MLGNRAAAWDLAIEAIDETLRTGVAPSLDRLGRLGQVGSLATLVEALGDEEAVARRRDRARPGA